MKYTISYLTNFLLHQPKGVEAQRGGWI
jgi:hypothetical protein